MAKKKTLPPKKLPAPKAKATLDDLLGELKTSRRLVEGLHLRLDKQDAAERAQEKRFMKSVEQYASELGQEIDTLNTTVAKQSTVVDGAKTAFTGLGNVIAGLKQQIADLIAQGGTADTTALEGLTAKLDAAQKAIDAKTDELAASVAAV